MGKSQTLKKTIIFILCVFLAILSLMPFVIMIVNSTRSTTEIQQHAVSLIPSKYFSSNLKILLGKSFNPAVGFLNSLIVSVGATVLAQRAPARSRILSSRARHLPADTIQNIETLHHFLYP